MSETARRTTASTRVAPPRAVPVLAVGVLAATLGMAPGMAPGPAAAQDSGIVGLGATSTATARATVLSVDPATRAVTLVGPAGNSFTVIAGPQVANFATIKSGDRVLARYHESVAYLLSPPNTKLPPNSLTLARVGAPNGAKPGASPGAIPAGAVGARLVLTGLVVALDPLTHTLQLVNPTGGGVVTVQVRAQAALRHFNQIKVGDTITAVVTRALAVALDPVG